MTPGGKSLTSPCSLDRISCHAEKFFRFGGISKGAGASKRCVEALHSKTPKIRLIFPDRAEQGDVRLTVNHRRAAQHWRSVRRADRLSFRQSKP